MLFLMPKILTSWLVRCWEHYTCNTRIEISSIRVSPSWHTQHNAGVSVVLWTRPYRQNNVFSYKWNELWDFLSLFTCASSLFRCMQHNHVMYGVMWCVVLVYSIPAGNAVHDQCWECPLLSSASSTLAYSFQQRKSSQLTIIVIKIITVCSPVLSIRKNFNTKIYFYEHHLHTQSTWLWLWPDPWLLVKTEGVRMTSHSVIVACNGTECSPWERSSG